MKVGDKVKVNSQDIPSDSITVSAIEDDGTIFFEEYYVLEKMEDGLFHLLGSSDIEMTQNDFTAEVPLSDSVEVNDSFSFLLTEEEKEAFKKAEKSGNPLFDSCFWWYCTKRDNAELSGQDPEKQGGFYDTIGSCRSVTIKDGVINTIFFFWT